jgi:hypothetical protein
MKERILTAFRQAGRNKRQLNRKLTQLESDLKKETGEKQVKWTEEYYLYLLETYYLSMDPAIEESIKLEEYEWADVLSKRKCKVKDDIEFLSQTLA